MFLLITTISIVCPKDNYHTPFIDHIIEECAGSEIFSFMDGFSGYNHINISHAAEERFYVL